MIPGWYFQLEGEEFDLQTIREISCETLALRESALCIRLDAPNIRAAQDSAHRMVSLLNAAAHVAFDNHRDVKVGKGFHEGGQDKPATQIVSPESVRSRSRVGGAGQLATMAMITAAIDPDFQRALWIFGVVPHDWRGLYVVLEVIQSGCHGLNEIAGSPLIKQAEAFKRTACSFETIGELARHGPKPFDPPTNPPTLEDAKTIIRTLLELWARKLQTKTKDLGPT